MASFQTVHAAGPKSLSVRPPLQVGPNRQFVLPSVAAHFAKDGDIVEIDAGIYDRDAAVWKQNDLTIKGIGGKAHIKAQGVAAQGKATWIVSGKNVVIENIEFSGARVPDRNGAGIRLEGTDLTVRNSHFHHNENGILCGGNPKANVVVENSEFAHNGFGDGQSHNIYCGRINSLTMRFNYIHHANVGHNIKSRATHNLILYNRIGDEADGNSSYAIDLPNGGVSVLLGNIIQKGPLAQNRTMISYGAEGYGQSKNALYVVNNTLINQQNDSGRFIFVRNGQASVTVANNLHFGPGSLLVGNGAAESNLAARSDDFQDVRGGDFHLSGGSRARGIGIDAGTVDGMALKPIHQYLHNASSKPRSNRKGIDLGAFEAD